MWISLSLSCFRFIQLPSFSFPKLGKFSAIMFSNIFSGPTLFLSSGNSLTWILYIFLLLTHRSLRPYSFFWVFFSFSCLDWIISIYLSSRPLAVSSQVFSLAHPVYLLVPLIYFSVLKFPFSSPLYSLFLCWSILFFYLFQKHLLLFLTVFV